jgi:kynurenine formamidase
MPLPDRVPKYAELPVVASAPPHSAWGVFGRDDQLGTLNFQTPERRLAATRLVRRGVVFSLDLPMHLPYPALIPWREPYRRTQFALDERGRDDYLDNFYLQCSSQWDGLRHMRNTTHGFYNWTPAEQVDAEIGRLGIENFSAHTITGRGVLLDVARCLLAQGEDYRPDRLREIPCELLDEVAAKQGVELQPGDVVMVRTGLGALIHEEAEHPERAERPMETAGLPAKDETLEWLWNHQVSAIVSDNVAVELRHKEQTPGMRRLHNEAIPLLGMVFGELFDLESLADDCAADGVYECLFVAKPLMIRGGVGSPANALAMK